MATAFATVGLLIVAIVAAKFALTAANAGVAAANASAEAAKATAAAYALEVEPLVVVSIDVSPKPTKGCVWVREQSGALYPVPGNPEQGPYLYLTFRNVGRSLAANIEFKILVAAVKGAPNDQDDLVPCNVPIYVQSLGPSEEWTLGVASRTAHRLLNVDVTGVRLETATTNGAAKEGILFRNPALPFHLP